MKEYIIESSKRYKKNHEIFVHDKPIHVIHDITNDLDLEYVSKYIENIIPRWLTRYFEGIYIGDFSFLNNSKFNALYKDGVIYATNVQDDEKDLIDDIVHEIAHSLEIDYSSILYEDGTLEKEFLAKRRFLYQLVDKEKNLMDFLNPNYSPAFDKYLHKYLSYDYLNSLSIGLFYSPYAITALKEYWANGFENYFLGDKRKLKEISPTLYNKIIHIVELNEELENEY